MRKSRERSVPTYADTKSKRLTYSDANYDTYTISNTNDITWSTNIYTGSNSFANTNSASNSDIHTAADSYDMSYTKRGYKHRTCMYNLKCPMYMECFDRKRLLSCHNP